MPVQNCGIVIQSDFGEVTVSRDSKVLGEITGPCNPEPSIKLKIMGGKKSRKLSISMNSSLSELEFPLQNFANSIIVVPIDDTFAERSVRP